MIGPPGGALVTGTLRSAREHDLAHELLSPVDVARRYPAFSLREDLVAVRDPRAGWLDPEACNAAHLRVAEENGAALHFNESVEWWEADEAGVRVTTRSGVYAAEHLVLAGGAYLSRMLHDLELPLAIERQAVFWFDADGDRYDQLSFPIYAYEYAEREICYGFPRLPRGIKASIMHAGQIMDDTASVDRSVAEDEVGPLRKALEPVLPELAAANVCERSVCLFTNTPDHDFVIDFHPQHRNVIVSSACSGHGFKFASVIGEIHADLVTEGHSRFDLEPFRISRLA
jgi:sarcosine oxidase